MVVVLADVAQYQRRHGGIEVASDEIGGYLVRQMPSAAHHPLLHGPGIRPYPQHLEIVIRFEDHHIRSSEMNAKRIGDIPKIGRNRDFYTATRQRIADGIDRVMRNGEARDVEVADREAPPRSKHFYRRLFPVPIDGLGSPLCHIDRKWTTRFSG